MILEKTPSDIVCLDKCKLEDDSYCNSYFHANKFQYPHFCRDRNMYQKCVMKKIF